jgi:hypothetical protein
MPVRKKFAMLSLERRNLHHEPCYLARRKGGGGSLEVALVINTPARVAQPESGRKKKRKISGVAVGFKKDSHLKLTVLFELATEFKPSTRYSALRINSDLVVPLFIPEPDGHGIEHEAWWTATPDLTTKDLDTLLRRRNSLFEKLTRGRRRPMKSQLTFMLYRMFHANFPQRCGWNSVDVKLSKTERLLTLSLSLNTSRAARADQNDGILT